MITLAIISKGGDGKSTSTGAYADAMARAGQTVLAVDLDGQATLSTWLMAAGATVSQRTTAASVLAGSIGLQLAALPVRSYSAGRLDVLAPGDSLARLETGDQRAKMARLRRSAELAGYSVLLLDTSASRPLGPAAGLQVAALSVADRAVVVARPNAASWAPVQALVARAHDVAAERERALPVSIQPTQVPATTTARGLAEALVLLGHPLPAVAFTTHAPDAMLGHRTLTEQAELVRRDPARRLAAEYASAATHLLEASA